MISGEETLQDNPISIQIQGIEQDSGEGGIPARDAGCDIEGDAVVDNQGRSLEADDAVCVVSENFIRCDVAGYGVKIQTGKTVLPEDIIFRHKGAILRRDRVARVVFDGVIPNDRRIGAIGIDSLFVVSQGVIQNLRRGGGAVYVYPDCGHGADITGSDQAGRSCT